ncbi:MAG: SpoVA/SpoVAEb family sporulation membrane protein, partial [Peptococcaceae bacterium]|nr:SpoVA/SpoVAEb family sporulation membrane protein [Peptococcaceae bacterium]
MSKSNLRPPVINMTPEEYTEITRKISPKPKVIKNAVLAFIVGGLICSIGQILINIYI